MRITKFLVLVINRLNVEEFYLQKFLSPLSKYLKTPSGYDDMHNHLINTLWRFLPSSKNKILFHEIYYGKKYVYITKTVLRVGERGFVKVSVL